MAAQFTASEHLNGSEHLSLRMITSPRSVICELHCVEKYSEPLLEKINVFQA